MKVLIIPKDPTYNGYILKPLVERLLASVGKPNAQVQVLMNPRAQGYEMIKALLPDVFERYRHFDLLLFLPDQDGRDRAAEFANLEEQAAAAGARLITCAAVQEVEAWLLAGHHDKLPESWPTVREDSALKERFFEPFLNEYGDQGAGGGRERLMREALRNFDGLLARCPELRELQARLREAAAA